MYEPSCQPKSSRSFLPFVFRRCCYHYSLINSRRRHRRSCHFPALKYSPDKLKISQSRKPGPACVSRQISINIFLFCLLLFRLCSILSRLGLDSEIKEDRSKVNLEARASQFPFTVCLWFSSSQGSRWKALDGLQLAVLVFAHDLCGSNRRSATCRHSPVSCHDFSLTLPFLSVFIHPIGGCLSNLQIRVMAIDAGEFRLFQLYLMC